MEYIITNSQYNMLLKSSIREQMQLKYKEIPRSTSDYLGKGGGFETAQSSPSMMKLEIGKKKGSSLDEAMEEFREGLFTPTGIAISQFLNSFGWGAPAVVSAYAALLGWDIYKSINGDTDWFNIIMGVFSVITSGVLSGFFAPLLKVSRGPLNSIAKVIEYLKSTKVWKNISPFLKTIVSGIGKVGSAIGTGLKWLAKNTGISFLLKVAGKILSFFSRITSSISNAISSTTTNLVSNITTNTQVAKAAGNAVKAGVQVKGLNFGADKIVGGKT